MSKEAKTIKLYSNMVDREWRRLAKDPYHRLEFDTTMVFLKKYLPRKGKILDAGGGPGRYSVELAKKGYQMTLLDFTPGNIEMAQKKIKAAKVQEMFDGIEVGDIKNLKRYNSNSFDAVMCLGGPLSHVYTEKGRKQAVKELTRVAKKGALIFISVMGKYGCVSMAPSRWPEEVNSKNHFQDLALRGDDSRWHGGRGYAHFFVLEELEQIIQKAGLTIVEQVGLEGLATTTPKAFNIMAKKMPKAYKNWLDTHYKMCTERTVVDTSVHFMVIAQKTK